MLLHRQVCQINVCFDGYFLLFLLPSGYTELVDPQIEPIFVKLHTNSLFSCQCAWLPFMPDHVSMASQTWSKYICFVRKVWRVTDHKASELSQSVTYHNGMRTQGFIRVCLFVSRSLVIGLNISLDYKWSLWKLDEDSEDYKEAIKVCHTRAAERILAGCLKNGGLYVKLGQVGMMHI